MCKREIGGARIGALSLLSLKKILHENFTQLINFWTKRNRLNPNGILDLDINRALNYFRTQMRVTGTRNYFIFLLLLYFCRRASNRKHFTCLCYVGWRINILLPRAVKEIRFLGYRIPRWPWGDVGDVFFSFGQFQRMEQFIRYIFKKIL